MCFAQGTIPFALQISFHSFSSNVIDSSSKLQSQMTFRLCAAFLEFGSRYNLFIDVIKKF
jgi:hypothetical protein